MAFLTDDELDTIAGRVFRARESTLEDEGRKLSLTDLVQTVLRVRHRLNTEVETLPPSAFEQQATDASGNEVWNAGRIVSHICQSELRFTESLHELVDLAHEPETEELKKDPELTMVEARGAIKIATVILRQTLKAIPEDADLSKTQEHERFGTIGVRGWLMLVAIHERGHVKQLHDLA